MSRSGRMLRLLGAAETELETVLLPGLQGRQRYAAAMLRRVLGLIRREFPQMAAWDAEDGQARHLASGIRSRRETSGPALRETLAAHVARKLEIDSPGYAETDGDGRP